MALPQGKLTKLTGDVIIIKGTPGLPGKDGESIPGRKGDDGLPGKDGLPPEHEVRGNMVRFKNPDGTWGKWVEAAPSSSAGGIGVVNVYHKVQQATFRVSKADLSQGTNIFGVNYAGAVEIILPRAVPSTAVIVVKDESGNASSNNITLSVEN